jgi:FkbM family methyltransferase
MRAATITAAGKELTILGTAPLYLQSIQGWNADEGALFACAKNLPAGSVVLDVGANIGVTCCTLGIQRPDLEIIAIEPVPENLACLRQNVAANGLQNVQVIHAAVSNKPSVLHLNNNGPWSTVLDQGEVTVPAIMLDDFAHKNVGLIKIDVEGWEPYVIAGGTKLLTSLRPQVLMEWNTWTLMLAHHDPISFSSAVWDAFDVNEIFHLEKPQGKPTMFIQIVHDNVTRYNSVSDILIVPKEGVSMPSLDKMISAPHRKEIA